MNTRIEGIKGFYRMENKCKIVEIRLVDDSRHTRCGEEKAQLTFGEK